MKKSFLILVSATLMLLLSGCEKETSISVDTFDTFVEDALFGTIHINTGTRYVDGVKEKLTPGGYYRMTQTSLLLLYADGTCRKGYSGEVTEENFGSHYFYRTLYWEADAERRVIRFTDRALQEQGARFAVTELQLIHRSFDEVTLKGMLPTDDKYAEAQDVYYVLEGLVRSVNDREACEERYRNETENPSLNN